MATVLAAQLAQLRAKSSNPLDLKAEKKAHSRSLIFEPEDAANQDFDTIYQLCYEGFLELCQLDPRFAPFAKSLFSEQSKQEDRTQMTEAQNKQLDVVVEDFLSLVGSRLLLKPALRTVEWLVRRFRSVKSRKLLGRAVLRDLL
jgi:U3 small nucleolar RNA-associated protein 10